jgi:hypothetical protein
MEVLPPQNQNAGPRFRDPQPLRPRVTGEGQSQGTASSPLPRYGHSCPTVCH